MEFKVNDELVGYTENGFMIFVIFEIGLNINNTLIYSLKNINERNIKA
jgi:hypothetical protein